MNHMHAWKPSIFVMLVLSSPEEPCVDLSYLAALPPINSPTLWDCCMHQITVASTRCLIAEVLEHLGRWRAAIEWARADLEDVHNRNTTAMTRTGRLLARCHAAVGEHSLSVAALDSALAAAKAGRLLLSEALSVRAMALVSIGRAAGSGGDEGPREREEDSPHWSEQVGRERLLEVMGRMVREGSGHELLEKLLLHGL